jgi:hypothetical protein
VEGPTEKTKDYATCAWAAEQLERDFDGKPFFMAVDVSKPHLASYVPQQFLDLYSLDEIEAAPFKRDGLDDILRKDLAGIYGTDPAFSSLGIQPYLARRLHRPLRRRIRSQQAGNSTGWSSVQTDRDRRGRYATNMEPARAASERSRAASFPDGQTVVTDGTCLRLLDTDKLPEEE